MTMAGSKVIAIVGPTASGKSDLGVFLAKKFNGEIISADSRQVYEGMDVGSGKITRGEMDGIPHHMLNVADPREDFTLAQYLDMARPILKDILTSGKTPFIVGGTGLYVTALLEGYSPPEVEPDMELRAELEKKSLPELQNIYQQIDPVGFGKIDEKNPRRLIRAIEVVKSTGKPFFFQQEKTDTGFEFLTLGVDIPTDVLKEKIEVRADARFPAMLEEVEKLNKKGVSWERLENFGLEYKWMAKLAQGQTDVKTAMAELKKDIIAYSRRQLTWWRKKDVIWISDYNDAEKKIRNFLTSD